MAGGLTTDREKDPLAVGGGAPDGAGVESAEKVGGGKRWGVMEVVALPAVPERKQKGPIGAGLVDAGIEQGVLAGGEVAIGESCGREIVDRGDGDGVAEVAEIRIGEFVGGGPGGQNRAG